MQQEIAQSINKIIDYLKKSQNDDGSFFSFEVGDDQMTKPYSTCFYPALILSSLAKIDSKQLSVTKDKTIRFLVHEKSDRGSFNYWTRKFKQKIDENYPDDLDDTACGFSALLASDKKLVPENELALITKILISAESDEGGPYFTWIVPKAKDSKWADLDLAVNSNIGFLLSLLGITLPNLNGFIEKAITSRNFSSPYYFSRNSILFFISRFYKDNRLDDLREIMAAESLKDFENPLECALLGLTLLNLGFGADKVDRHIKFLLSKQQEDGSFGIFPFVIERAGQEKRVSGSNALTTVLALELMTRYGSLLASAPQANKKSKLALLQKRVISHCRQILSSQLNKELCQEFEVMLSKIIKDDTDYQITLHPFLFIQSLKVNKKIDDRYLLDLACASIFGWVAYTIYDDILDEKKGISMLPLAIICSRELEDLYCKNNPLFRPIFKKFMNRVDQANFYEIHQLNFSNKNYRYPTVDFAAEKSLAHALSVLAIVFEMGYKEESLEFQTVTFFYQKYLTARQLNDDAHDWEEDLGEGRITYATDCLIQDFIKKNEKFPRSSEDSLKLQKTFWSTTITRLSRTIQENIHQARKGLQSLGDLVEINFLASKIDGLENAAKKSLTEKAKTISYLDTLFEKENKIKD